MSRCTRDELIHRALFAAAAVTGRRLRKATAGAAVGSALLLAACDDKSAKEESQAAAADTAQASQPDTASTEAPDTAVAEESPDTASAPSPDVEETAASCLDAAGGSPSYTCCLEHGRNDDGTFRAEGCTFCGFDDEPRADCVTCALPPDEAEPIGHRQDDACCEAVGWQYDMGCMAWGPPAPPAWAGHRIDAILGPRRLVLSA